VNKKKGFRAPLTVSALVLSLAMSTPALATSAYATKEWYLNYLRQYSGSRTAATQPASTQMPTTSRAPQTAQPPTTRPLQTTIPPGNLPSGYYQVPQGTPQPTNNWYLNYLNRYQLTGPIANRPANQSQPPAAPPGVLQNPSPDRESTPSEPSADNPSLTAEEEQLMSYINEERARNGVGPVVADQELVRIARLRAEKLVELDYFDHNIPGYGTAGQQLTRDGYRYAYVGENLSAAGSVYQAHAQIVRSSAHRQIMLDPKFTKVGIGIAHYTNKAGIVVVEIFVEPY